MSAAAPRSPAHAAAHGGGSRVAWWLLAVILAIAALHPWWPLSDHQRWALYCGVETVAIALAWWFTARRSAPLAWRLLLGGMTCNVVADLLYFHETVIVGMGNKAALSDAIYALAYVPLVAGLASLGRRIGRDAGALLDAGIFAIGLAVPVVAFYIVPAAAQATIGLDGMLLIGWYSLGSVLVFALYVRQVTSSRSRNPAFLILGAALLMSAIGDTLWNVHLLGTTPLFDDLPKVLWYLNRTLPLVVIAHPAVRALWNDDPGSASTPLPRMRLVALAIGASMPAITLLLAHLGPSAHPYWIAVVGGGLLLPALVLVRMDGMLQQLRAQAHQLDTLSHYDELTGAPNRRQWNRALATAAAHARSDHRPLALALLDLDHFKAFNDAHGHHAGDDLLCGAYAAWSALLRDDCLLARIGGEEFALMMPGTTAVQAAQVLVRLQQATPRGQMFSAGVSECDPHADLANALDSADAALYDAKQAGRRRVHVADATGGDAFLAFVEGAA